MSDFLPRAEHVTVGGHPALLLGVQQVDGAWQALVAVAMFDESGTSLRQEWVAVSEVSRLANRAAMHTAPPPRP